MERGNAYTSLEQKSMRERYILVAAIDRVINAGIKNICGAKMHKKRASSPTDSNRSKIRHTILNASGFGRRVNILRF
jgi:hypothetical protein